MRLFSPPGWSTVLAPLCALSCAGCHGPTPRAAESASAVRLASSAAPKDRDTAWKTRAAVVTVDPGNSLANRRSESAFSVRTSRAGVASHTSSLLVQVAALNHSIARKQPLIEQQLRALGLQVVGRQRSNLRHPNDYNVLVEDVTYVDEPTPESGRGPLTFTIVPALHVRVISANERRTLEGAPITVKLRGNLTPTAAEVYGRQLASTRAELGQQLIRWLETRLPLTPTPSPAAPSNGDADAKGGSPTVAHNTPVKE